MARYREKDETDLRWNKIRRRLTMELDVQLKDFREDALNTLLSGAWKEYVAALGEGKVLELEAGYEGWVTQALRDAGVEARVDDEVA